LFRRRLRWSEEKLAPALTNQPRYIRIATPPIDAWSEKPLQQLATTLDEGNMLRLRKATVIIVTALSTSQLAAADTAANPEKSKYATVCAACHGANGVRQRTRYLMDQLHALRDGSRKSDIMNPIASQLGTDDIKSLSKYYSTQVGNSGEGKSAFLPSLTRSHVVFPSDYKRTFIKYHVLNVPEDLQVKYYYANNEAVRAADAGRALPDGSTLLVEIYSAKLDATKRPLVGSDGYFIPDRLLSYPVSSRGPGWGDGFPDMLRNGNWNYTLFGADQRLHSNSNQAECLACHKAMSGSDYTFTSSHLKAGRRPT
jgi:cytochrome c553